MEQLIFSLLWMWREAARAAGRRCSCLELRETSACSAVPRLERRGRDDQKVDLKSGLRLWLSEPMACPPRGTVERARAGAGAHAAADKPLGIPVTGLSTLSSLADEKCLRRRLSPGNAFSSALSAHTGAGAARSPGRSPPRASASVGSSGSQWREDEAFLRRFRCAL